jgi:hypothetical protein
MGRASTAPTQQSHLYNIYNTINLDGFTKALPCPFSHPICVPQVIYETVWDTTKFNGLWTSGLPNLFVWSFEVTSGYRTHADYMFGWKDDALERAKRGCFSGGCGLILSKICLLPITAPSRIWLAKTSTDTSIFE